MDNKDIHALRILEKVGGNDIPLSQRSLAKELNISLGLVNSFIKRLVRKGFVKISTIPKNRIRYILTPNGATEKTRLTYAYIQYSFSFYKNARQNLRILFQNLEHNGVKNIIFYGLSDLTEIAYLSIQETSFHLIAIVDDKEAGNIFLGNRIRNSNHIAHINYDLLLITTLENVDLARQKIRSLNVPSEKVIEIV